MVAILRPPPRMRDLTDTAFPAAIPVNQVPIWNGVAWVTGAPIPGLHAPTHQFGGVDQINIAGLPGISAQLALHLADFLNPHAVTWAQVGAIPNVPNIIDDTLIDWGVGPNQVSADDIPDGVVNAIVTLVQEAAWDAHLIAVNNPHVVTLDQAYNAGATITVDAAGGDLIFNLAAATDFKIQDGGVDVWVFDDTGGLTQTAPAALATMVYLNGATNQYTGAALARALRVRRIQSAASAATGFNGIYVQTVTNKPGIITETGLYFLTDDNAVITSTHNITSFGGSTRVYNASVVAAITKTLTYWGGHVLVNTFTPPFTFMTINNAGAVITLYVYGVEAETNSSVNLVAGALTAYNYGLYANAIGNLAGAHTTFGVYGTASGADDNHAGYFYRNTTGDTTPVVTMVQDHLTAGCPVLALQQDDISEGFIDFLGSDRGAILENVNSVESVRVELNGVVRRLALYADA